jgi:hypothetical protein
MVSGDGGEWGVLARASVAVGMLVSEVGSVISVSGLKWEGSW